MYSELHEVKVAKGARFEFNVEELTVIGKVLMTIDWDSLPEADQETVMEFYQRISSVIVDADIPELIQAVDRGYKKARLWNKGIVNG